MKKLLKNPKPPKTLWQLLELALTDLEKAEKSKKHKIDMDVWYKPNGVCTVCLAGSVMAFSLDAAIRKEVLESCGVYGVWDDGLAPDNMGEWGGSLEAIDCARGGSMAEAFASLRPGILKRDWTTEEWFGLPKKQMTALAGASFSDLEKLSRGKDLTEFKARMRESIAILKKANV